MIIQGATIYGTSIYDQSDLYPFSFFTFTSNIVGAGGPTLGNLYNTYSNAGNTWITNTEYFTVPNDWRGFQIWTVPRTGPYQIIAAGSRSGIAVQWTANVLAANAFGRGAVVQSVFNLERGQKITLVVGQPSANTTTTGFSSPGGGGGSFVMLGNIASVGFANVIPLVIAGGGGACGTWSSNTLVFPGGYGVTTKRGGNGAGNSGATITANRVGAPGGINGLGGNTHVNVNGTVSNNGYDSGGGGGWSGNGLAFGSGGIGWTTNTAILTSGGQGGGAGNSIQFKAVGGISATAYAPPATSFGGFGGGSGSGPITGGAGGGYSGGGGAYSGGNPAIDSGGGGGSYIDSNASSVATSDGQFDLSGTFNGASITNLGFYNNTAGYISIVRV
jgi:hypothetical protein